MAGATGEGDALSALTITEGGVTVTVRPLGFRDFYEIPEALIGIGRLVREKRYDDAMAAHKAFADRIDRYATGDPRPSDVPQEAMEAFVMRWVSGVRDAAVPPTSAGPSPKPGSSSRRGARQPSPSA